MAIEIQQDLISECRLMLRFARESGGELPPALEHDIAQLDTLLTQQGLPTIIDIPPQLVRDNKVADPPAPPPTEKPWKELLLSVHGQLSKAIAPATVLSLIATQPSSGTRGFWDGMPRVVQLAAGIALISAIGFAVSASFIAARKPALQTAGTKATDTPKPAPAKPDDKPADPKAPAPKAPDAKTTGTGASGENK